MPQADRRSQALEPLRQGDVLHQRLVREAAHCGEGFAADEDRLVPGGDAGQAGAQVHQQRHDLQHPGPSRDQDIEASPEPPPQGRLDERDGIRRQAGIGVEKDQSLALGHGGAGVHLPGPTPGGGEDPVDPGGRQVGGAITATAIDQNDLMTLGAQGLKGGQGRHQARRLVQGGKNEGQAHGE